MNKLSPHLMMDTTACHAVARAQFRMRLHQSSLSHVSFDVFDTVLLRRCTDPSGVLEKAYYLLPLHNHNAVTANLFVQHRQLSEHKARKIAKAKRGSPEVSIQEIYSHFPFHVFGLPRGDCSTLINAEFAAEQALCFANPDIHLLCKEAQSCDKAVGFISDTYWSTEQLRNLLLSCIPDLTYDFLYASSDHHRGKSEGLFHIYTGERGIAPIDALHMGDNPQSDVRSPSELGMQAIHYPQASDELTAIFTRESSIAKLIAGPTASTLDTGLRTARRQICGSTNAADTAFAYGCSVIGPVMTAFDRFIQQKVHTLENAGNSVAVAFIARDGWLSHVIWQSRHDKNVGYAEVNRRTALIGAADTEVIVQFFSRLPSVDLASASRFFKGITPQLKSYFGRSPTGIVRGNEFAKALPDLIDAATRRAIAAQHRQSLLRHLRQCIPDFDTCTDLILVDLGYSGTVQKGLRAIFDAEKLTPRLHGVYLLCVDEDLNDIGPKDTACSYLGGHALPPAVRHTVLDNISILEQICSAADGSVRSYSDTGQIQREDDPRPEVDKALTSRIRDGALCFAQQAHSPAFSNSDAIAPWIAASLARALWLPTDTELELLAPLRHDVNLGTHALAAMADPNGASNKIAARPFHAAMNVPQPAMWKAGSLSAISPLHGYLYAMFASGNACPDTWHEAALPTAPVVAFPRSGVEHHLTIPANCVRTLHGEYRMRIPLARSHNIGTISVPASSLPPRAEICGLTLQTGTTLKSAATSDTIEPIDQQALLGADLTIRDGIISTSARTGCLLIPIAPLKMAFGLLTLTVKPLDGLRLLAPTKAGASLNG